MGERRPPLTDGGIISREHTFMLRVGLWNVGEAAAADMLATWTSENDLNVAVILELGVPRATVLEAFNDSSDGRWFLPNGNCDRVSIFTRFSDAYSRRVIEGDRHSIRAIGLPALPEVLLAAVHLKSKLHTSPANQAHAAGEVARAVRRAERKVMHKRTVVLGDFNMDPHEDGMLAASSFHGMVSHRSALRQARMIDRKPHDMFYNPTWGLLGDRQSGPPGTYRYWNSAHINQEWHVFDQVLIRPALIPHFEPDSLRVVSRIGDADLLSSDGIPSVSDHLPIIFSINEIGDRR